jgi:carbonic anhydrase/acetyltransferase-like protein (isoleucine patch superfamily)
MKEPHATTDAARRSLGFLSLRETIALASQGVAVPDPNSVLVSPGVILGAGVVLWPNVILQIPAEGGIAIGAGSVLFPGARIVASGGLITVGSDVEIGEEGGFTIKAESGDMIEIGDGARLLGGGSLTRSNRLGRGAQIMGPIRCQDCRLGDGGTYRDPEPDERGGVLKGSGVARRLEVPQGHVIQAFGLFADGVMRRQSYFHPKAER